MAIEDGRDAQVIERAAQRLARGELVAFATETVYGLGARADDDAAVARIFAAKGRPPEHPLIVHVADASAALQFVVQPGAAAQRLMQALWPGPVSLVLLRQPGQAAAAAGDLPTLALRCPSHPVARSLLQRARALGVPGIAAPSANRFGRVSPTRAVHVQEEFGPELLILDGGACEAGIESAIVDCSGTAARLLRPGSVPLSELRAALGADIGSALPSSPQVSGSLASHYAPAAQLHLVTREQLASCVAQLTQGPRPLKMGVFARAWPPGVARAADAAFIPMPDNARDAAHLLFDSLRRFDALGVDAVCVETPPDDATWDGVRDRLQRAAAPR